MNCDSETVVLFDAVGRSLRLTAQHWSQSLSIAIAHGWCPAGTTPPPRNSRVNAPDWHGRYEEPLGQSVTAGDARRFAHALGRAAEPELDPNIAALALFAARGSFIVCPLTPELDRALESLLNLAHHLEESGTGIPACVDFSH